MSITSLARTLLLASLVAGVPAWLFAGSAKVPNTRLVLAEDALYAIAPLPALLVAGAAIFMTGIDHAFLRSRPQATRLVLAGFRRTLALSISAVVLLPTYRALESHALRHHWPADRLLFSLTLTVVVAAYLATYLLMRQMLNAGLAYLHSSAGA